METAKKIVVVGNGPSIVNVPLGWWIDEYEAVVRLNKYKIIDDLTTGLKTTCWATTRHLTWEELAKSTANRILYIASTARPPEWARSPLTSGRFLNTGFDVWHTILKKHNAIVPGGHPSSGLVVIEYLLQFFDQVSIHGFDAFGPSLKHYWEEKLVPPDANKHWPKAERQIVQDWVDQGKVVRLSERSS